MDNSLRDHMVPCMPAYSHGKMPNRKIRSGNSSDRNDVWSMFLPNDKP